MKLSKYQQRLPTYAGRNDLNRVMEALQKAEKPVLYVGGGCLDASQEVREFARKTGIPVVQTLMGLGAFPTQDSQALGMLGMHGTIHANYAVDSSDLLIALGVRFDDRVTGKLEAFASRAQIIHIDIDPAEISKNKDAHIPICADVKMALK